MRMIMAILTVLISITSFAYAQPPAKIIVEKVTEKEIAKTNQMLGVLEFDKHSGISPEIAGLIDRLSYTEGMQVKKGDILVSLNTDFIQKSIAIRIKGGNQRRVPLP